MAISPQVHVPPASAGEAAPHVALFLCLGPSPQGALLTQPPPHSPTASPFSPGSGKSNNSKRGSCYSRPYRGKEKKESLRMT